MTTGAALAVLRCRAGLTKTQLGRLVGVSVHTITALERDHTPWRTDVGSRLLHVLSRDDDFAILCLMDAQQHVRAGRTVIGVPIIVH